MDGLDALHDRRDGAAVVHELFGAVVHLDIGVPAGELVRGALVRILKAAPPAHVVHEDGVEIRVACFDISEQRPQAGAVLQEQAAPGVIGVRARDLQVVRLGIASNDLGLFSVEYCWCSADMRT